MKAIILNSGSGSRMGTLTGSKPKCLIELNGEETILSRQLKMLSANGVNSIIITTGHFEEKIRTYVDNFFPELDVEYVYNPKYNSTNYIYSLFLAKNQVHSISDDNKPILLIHGDMVFDEEVLQRLLKTEHQNAVLMNSKAKLPEKDFKGRIKDNTVMEIGVNTFGEDCLSLLPIYKFSKLSFTLWLKEMEEFVNRGEHNVYAENAFNNIPYKLNLKPVYFDDETCMEVDNPEDLTNAKTHLSRDIKKT